MMAVRRPATWFALAVACAVSASAQLNPTVKVLESASTPIPPECAEGLAAAPPRIVAEAQPAPQPKRAPAPPSLDLRTRLRAVESAAAADDRDAFKAALADAKAAVASYPTGGERDAANDVLSVYSDLEKLWDYAFTSPSGAFFDSSTDFVSMMRRYPDYQRFIAENTLSVGGQTIYPTRETRQFLKAEAARRLARLGVRPPTRVTEAQPQPTPRPAAKPKPKPPVATKKATVHHAPATGKKPVTKIARAKPAPPMPRHVERAPKPAPAPNPAPVSKPAPQPTPVAPAPAPRAHPRRPQRQQVRRRRLTRRAAAE